MQNDGIPTICIAGKNQIAVECATWLISNVTKDILIIPNRGDTGQDNWQPSLLRWAKQNSVEVTTQLALKQTPKLLFVSLEYDKIIRPSGFLSDSRFYNIHFSLLPKYKGVYTSAWPILEGMTETGVTLHKIDHGIDTGPIIEQTVFPVGCHDTALDVYNNYQAHGIQLFKQRINSLICGDYVSLEQSPVGSSYKGKGSIDYGSLQIDLRQTAHSIQCQVRAYNFRPFQIPRIFGYPVSSTHFTKVRSCHAPGTIVRQRHDSIVIATIDYDLSLEIDPLESFIDACNADDYPNAESWIEKITPVDLRNHRGWSALMVAAYHARLGLVDKLVGLGADLNATSYHGTSVLMYAKSGAVITKDYRCLKFLLERGADASITDHKGLTVLDYAKQDKDDIVLQMLA